MEFIVSKSKSMAGSFAVYPTQKSTLAKKSVLFWLLVGWQTIIEYVPIKTGGNNSIDYLTNDNKLGQTKYQ